jgi:hypothetical protein
MRVDPSEVEEHGGFIVRICLVGAALTAVLLTGCAAPAGDLEVERTPLASNSGLLCNHVPISRRAIEDRVPLQAIGEAGRDALAQARTYEGDALDLSADQGWYLATATDDIVGVMRDVAAVADPVSPGAPRDRELVVVRWQEGTNHLEPGWYVEQGGMCALTVDLGDLTVPTVELESPPDPLSRELHLLATEEKCNSGEDAEGRIEVVDLKETDERVSLVLGVRPREGAQTCPSNPTTPFTLTLAEPLGDREIVDGALVEPRILTTGP